MKNKVLMYFSLIKETHFSGLKILLLFFLLLGFWCTNLSAQGQETPLRCGTTEYSQFLADKDADFAKHYYAQESFPLKSSETTGGIDIVIPIIVHVLYNNVDQNISVFIYQHDCEKSKIPYPINSNIILDLCWY